MTLSNRLLRRLKRSWHANKTLLKKNTTNTFYNSASMPMLLLVKPEGCRCCMENNQRCRYKMSQFENSESNKCIIDHPGFNDICLNEWVLDSACRTGDLRNYKTYMELLMHV